jgi:hypothetical protein
VLLKQAVDGLHVEGFHPAVLFQNGNKAFKYLGVEGVLVEQVVDDSLASDQVEDVLFLYFEQLYLPFCDFLELLDSFHFGLESSLLLKAGQDETDIVLLQSVGFLFQGYYIRVEHKDLLIVSELVGGERPLRTVLFEQMIEVLMSAEGQPLAVLIIGSE